VVFALQGFEQCVQLVCRASAATLEGAVSWPLPPGKYVVRLLVDDSYISIAHSRHFRIRAS
jgi:hypothetical protein